MGRVNGRCRGQTAGPPEILFSVGGRLQGPTPDGRILLLTSGFSMRGYDMEEELRIILAHSERAGILSEPNLEIIEGVFQFRRRTAKQIMVPRTDVTALIRAGLGGGSATMSVPGASGRIVFLMRSGIAFASSGRIVRGCSTLAPK